ncbi:MAG TPA: metal ABC transporter permease [Nakamurella sp.]
MSVWDKLFSFENYGELLTLLHNSILAGALLGLIGGLIGVFVVMRDLTFAVHGISELSFAGAAFALLVGFNVVIGSILGSLSAALLIGFLGVRARERSSFIGVLMPFGLGLGVLFLALYPGRAANKFGLLTGQIVAVDDPQLFWMLGVSAVVIAVLAILWRPLMFATVDPEIAAARGVPVRALSPVFMIVLGLTVAMAVQVVGALLVLALLVTPAAAAMRVTASALWVPVLSVIFGVTSVVGGILLALGGSLPISPYVTTISFLIYVVCRITGNRRLRRGWARRTELAEPAASPADRRSQPVG